MTITNLVLRAGVGASNTIASIVLHGLSPASPMPTTVGGHFVETNKKRLKALREKEQEKLLQAKTLRKQINEARGIEDPDVISMKSSLLALEQLSEEEDIEIILMTLH